MVDAPLSDHEQWPHRFDERSQRIGFIPVSRDLHRQCTFITDEHLPQGLPVTPVPLSAVPQSSAPKNIHFVFHSAYCCSTMVARAFDLPGVSMGLKEPQALNDLIGWRRRGGTGEPLKQAMAATLNLLARPFGDGEVNVIKPSNIVNPLAEAALELVPKAKAVLLFAPIESYLVSIAKKGLWGRRWVREVLIGTIADGRLLSGFEDQNLLELTDLQVAALGWLSHHAIFLELRQSLGAERVMMLDSASLLADTSAAMRAVVDHLGLNLTDEDFARMMAGPAFTTHSKDASQSFTADDRDKEQERVAAAHGDEISMVAQWTHAVAQSQGIRL